MRPRVAMWGLLLGALGIGFATLREPAQVETCVARAPDLTDRRASRDTRPAGFELIDPLGGGVWLTLDWTVESFEDYSLPWSWGPWFKNDPRRGVANGARFLRSPGCEQDGQFTYMHALGRDFLQVVELQWMDFRPGASIRRVELEKYHALTFGSGTTVRVLEAPSDEAFVLVAETYDRSEEPVVPEGWRITTHQLDEPLVVELMGEVSVLRLPNGDSFQGPLTQDALARLSG